MPPIGAALSPPARHARRMASGLRDVHKVLENAMKFDANMSMKLKFDTALARMRNPYSSPVQSGVVPDGVVVSPTPLERNKRLSDTYGCNVFLKREDLQTVRSFKIRGAYNKIINAYQRLQGDSIASSIREYLQPELERQEAPGGSTAVQAGASAELMPSQAGAADLEVVTCSAGNHAQGVALSCAQLGLKHHIFVPQKTPLQKVSRIRSFGGDLLTLHRYGNSFDESQAAAREFVAEREQVGKVRPLFVHPFDDEDVIVGQGTVATEIFEQLHDLGTAPDIVICCVGGGGLVSGVGTYSKLVNPDVKIFGAEPKNADCLRLALENGGTPTPVENLDTFVDGASVRVAGKKTSQIARVVVDEVYVVDPDLICYTMVQCYQNEGIVLEPAGALALACLKQIWSSTPEAIRGLNVVCVTSGGNNDIDRYPLIQERALIHLGLKHYFLCQFAQKPGQLKQFVNEVVGDDIDITRFEYLKKSNRDMGPVLVGLELQNPSELEPLIKRLEEFGEWEKIDPMDPNYSYFI